MPSRHISFFGWRFRRPGVERPLDAPYGRSGFFGIADAVATPLSSLLPPPPATAALQGAKKAGAVAPALVMRM